MPTPAYVLGNEYLSYRGDVYNNQSADTQFLESIANVERNKLKDLLPKVIFFLHYYGWKYG
jgi:hypothetical protein